MIHRTQPVTRRIKVPWSALLLQSAPRRSSAQSVIVPLIGILSMGGRNLGGGIRKSMAGRLSLQSRHSLIVRRPNSTGVRRRTLKVCSQRLRYIGGRGRKRWL